MWLEHDKRLFLPIKHSPSSRHHLRQSSSIVVSMHTELVGIIVGETAGLVYRLGRLAFYLVVDSN